MTPMLLKNEYVEAHLEESSCGQVVDTREETAWYQLRCSGFQIGREPDHMISREHSRHR